MPSPEAQELLSKVLLVLRLLQCHGQRLGWGALAPALSLLPVFKGACVSEAQAGVGVPRLQSLAMW